MRRRKALAYISKHTVHATRFAMSAKLLPVQIGKGSEAVSAVIDVDKLSSLPFVKSALADLEDDITGDDTTILEPLSLPLSPSIETDPQAQWTPRCSKILLEILSTGVTDHIQKKILGIGPNSLFPHERNAFRYQADLFELYKVQTILHRENPSIPENFFLNQMLQLAKKANNSEVPDEFMSRHSTAWQFFEILCQKIATMQNKLNLTYISPNQSLFRCTDFASNKVLLDVRLSSKVPGCVIATVCGIEFPRRLECVPGEAFKDPEFAQKFRVGRVQFPYDDQKLPKTLHGWIKLCSSILTLTIIA